MIHEYKYTFGYKKSKYTFGYLPKSYQKSYQKPYQKPCQKSYTKRDQKCDINTITMTNKTQTNSQTNVNSGQSCLAVNKHVVINMAARITFEEKPTDNLPVCVNKDHLGGKAHSTEQCISGINIFNNCISEIINQIIMNDVAGQKEIYDSKFKTVDINELPIRSQHVLFSRACPHDRHDPDLTKNTDCQIRHRDREPSRIPVKRLTRKFRKSRLLRKQLKHNIKRSVPRSSQLHYIVWNLCRKNTCHMKRVPDDIYCPTKKVGKRNRTKLATRCLGLYVNQGILADIFYLSGFTRDIHAKQQYKNSNHLKSVSQSALYTDIETNPGPVFIDPGKTICAPYSQGNLMLFGESAGQQCLAMCLCALIYSKRQCICSSQDLAQIMNIGNELYSNLSHSAGQSFLMFTELPSELTVFDTNYLFEYSESYNGTVMGNCSIEGY